MRKASLEFLKELIAAPSPSGYEQPAQRVWRTYAEKHSDQLESDFHGNSFAVLNPKGTPRLMFAGHCDELGFIVKYIDEKGFLYFDTVGGHDKGIIPGRRVIIHSAKGTVTGVTGKKAIHLMTPEDRKKVPEIENLWIDIGVSSKEQVEKLVTIGDPIVYDTGFQEINESIATSRGFDDKVGAFAVIEALRLLKGKKLACAVHSVATVQEEVGLRGARTSGYAVDPQVGVAVDVTHATDSPEINVRRDGEIKLGGGPVILRGANANPKVVELLMDAANAEKIPFQIEAIAGGTGTDANAIQLSRGGVATGLVSIPLRYMHTPSEVVSLEDVKNTAKLLAAFAQRVTPEVDFKP
ncbi:MAG: M42 family metallopeptidase [Deferribacteres bacterium]|nr:M42 family metallopeptidase [candidate division KSB1 bacterium]MCB9511145.1 M42 family metallopeptidase [Deferribacteres bacterium]